MSAERIFYDANVLVYAHDRSETAKHEQAKRIVSEAWSAKRYPALSIQVLQETHVTLVRKGLDPRLSSKIVLNYLEWELVENRESLFRTALEFQVEFQLSFWDASILAAAVSAGVDELWSEDFQTGRRFHGVRVVNPFLTI